MVEFKAKYCSIAISTLLFDYIKREFNNRWLAFMASFRDCIPLIYFLEMLTCLFCLVSYFLRNILQLTSLIYLASFLFFNMFFASIRYDSKGFAINYTYSTKLPIEKIDLFFCWVDAYFNCFHKSIILFLSS